MIFVGYGGRGGLLLSVWIQWDSKRIGEGDCVGPRKSQSAVMGSAKVKASGSSSHLSVLGTLLSVIVVKVNTARGG